MRRWLVPIISVISVSLLAQPAWAGTDHPVCTTRAFASLVTPPPMTLACDSDAPLCRSDTPSSLVDNPECATAAAAYANHLQKLLTPNWWSSAADGLEACRIRGKTGALTTEEAGNLALGYGKRVQGNDRVRLLVLGDVCGTTGISNAVMVVRTATGVAVTPLYFAFNQGGVEAPFSFDVVHNGADTIVTTRRTCTRRHSHIGSTPSAASQRPILCS
jgi:hypothetical protein